MDNLHPNPFDEILLSRSRLSILSALLNESELEFTYLQKTLGLTDGNLSVQIRKLEDAGYIKIKKVFLDRKPKTFCKITTKGKKAVENLAAALDGLLKQKPD